MEINLKLSLEEVNGIIGTLSMLPFGQVADLVMKVRNQAIEQVQASQPKTEDVPTEQVEQ